MRNRFTAILIMLLLIGSGLGKRMVRAQNLLPHKERLVFSIEYFGIHLGDATLEIKDIISYNDHKVYWLASRAVSAPWLSALYKVDDRICSYMDVTSICSLKFVKDCHEGNYVHSVKISFNQERHFAYYEDNDRRLEIPPLVQDPLSGFYYLRTKDLKIGESIFMPMHDDEKNWDLEIKVLRKEIINTKVGKFRTIVVRPMFKSSGLFRSERGIWIWLTDDEKRIPVRMETKIPLGSIVAHLKEIN
ncbi:MAG: DUF3108 domain-containing protein [bacterium]|nr:DUF3108 domain-containing protein [bacterium]